MLLGPPAESQHASTKAETLAVKKVINMMTIRGIFFSKNSINSSAQQL